MRFRRSINACCAFKLVCKLFPFSVGIPRAHLVSHFRPFFAVYSAAIQEANNVLYDGLIEELVEVLNVRDPTLTVSAPLLSAPDEYVFWLSLGHQSVRIENAHFHHTS